MIAAYLVYNRISVGVFMPTSGSVKAGLSIVGNLHFFDQVILPKNWFLTRGPTWLFSEVFMRVFQMIVPAIICGIFLFQPKIGVYAAATSWRRCVSASY